MMIEPVERIIGRQVCIQPAQLKDTGRFTTSYEDDGKGNVLEIRKPIKELVEAQYKTINETVIVYIVNDGVDMHEFKTENDAKAFLGVK